MPLTGAIDFGQDGNQSIHPIDVDAGTMTIEENRVVIDYVEHDGEYRVIYVQQ